MKRIFLYLKKKLNECIMKISKRKIHIMYRIDRAENIRSLDSSSQGVD